MGVHVCSAHGGAAESVIHSCPLSFGRREIEPSSFTVTVSESSTGQLSGTWVRRSNRVGGSPHTNSRALTVHWQDLSKACASLRAPRRRRIAAAVTAQCFGDLSCWRFA